MEELSFMLLFALINKKKTFFRDKIRLLNFLLLLIKLQAQCF
jgi:hypothetical protein